MKYNPASKDIKIPGTTWLQGIGHVYGKMASDIVPGDVLAWNYGCKSVVKSVGGLSKMFMQIIEIYDGKEYVRRIKKDRIVAIA